MATATAERQESKGSKPQGLWCGVRIPIILLSAEINAGKSIFCVTVDDNCRKPDVEPTTIMWDQEGSLEPYTDALNFVWKDTRAAVMEGVHLKKMPYRPEDPKWRRIILGEPDVNDYPSASLFRAWYLSLLNIPRGKFRVGGVDTWTPLQEGLIEWLKCHPEAFGRTRNQYDNASSMFLWPDVKTVMSYILATDCRLRFETFCMTVHMKNEWERGSKTGNRIAEGLDVLDKLATLHLRLDRTAPAKNKEAPRVPSAIVIKERLIRFGLTSDDDAPLLPPRLPKATPDAIRQYILNPPNYSALKKEEQMPDTSMSEDDRLLIRAQISENEKQISEHEMSRLEIMKRAATAQAAAQQQQQPQQVQQSGEPAKCTPQQDKTIRELLPHCFDVGTEFGPVLQGFGVQKIADLTESQAEELLVDLYNRKAKRQLKRTEQKGAELAATSTVNNASNTAAATAEVKKSEPPPKPATQVVDPDGPITDEQYERLKATVEEVNWPVQHQNAYKQSKGIGSFRSLTYRQAEHMIQMLPLVKRLGDKAREVGWTTEQQVAWRESQGIETYFDLSIEQIDDRIAKLMEIELGFAGSVPKN